MSTFIIGARKEIEVLWDDLLFGEEERAEFMPYQDDEFSEELLARHEEEIARLKEERRIKAPIRKRSQRSWSFAERREDAKESGEREAEA